MQGSRVRNTDEQFLFHNFYKLDYLFKSQRLKPEDFATMGTGQRVYKYSDLPKIKAALFEVERR